MDMIRKATMSKESNAPKEPKQKTRAKTRLKQKVQKTKSHNQSEDLKKLTEDYNTFCKRLQGLVNALTNQHAAMQQLAKAKFQVAQHLAVISKDTVLYEMTGQTAGADRSTESVNSYFSVQEGATNKTNMYINKYKEHIIDYAHEWHKVVTERVGAGLKKADTLLVELDHYQSKVESLRQSANSTMAKGKQVDTKAAEKLTRNEDKLIKIKESSSKFINELCLLMEEITERSWRDLNPLLIKCSQFEAQVASDEAKAMHSLMDVVTSLKKVASDHGIKPRLKDLEKLEPHTLSTRSKDDIRSLAIENGFSGLALGSGGGSVISGDGSVYSAISGVDASIHNSNANASYFPPGSTAAQGLGGFPVKVKSSDPFAQSTTSSSTNGGGAPSTMSMMNLNAAPAPTMDTMAQAFSNGGHRPSTDSNFSRTPAPPPSSAPPPPPPGTPGDHHPNSTSGLNPFGSAPGSSNPFGAGAPAPMQSPYGAPPAHGPYGAASPGPYGIPAAGGGGVGSTHSSTYNSSTHSRTYGGPTWNEPAQQSPYGQPPPQQQQSPYGPPPPQQQRSPMPPMGGAGNLAQQQSPVGGGFSAQQAPMGGGGNFAQHQNMYASPQPQRTSATSGYGQNNPFNY